MRILIESDKEIEELHIKFSSDRKLQSNISPRLSEQVFSEPEEVDNQSSVKFERKEKKLKSKQEKVELNLPDISNREEILNPPDEMNENF